MRPLRVLLVTTWNTACGIAEMAAYLKESVETADGGIEILPTPEALDPYTTLEIDAAPQILHLNYQAALLSRWTPLVIKVWREKHPGIPIVVTFHDTGVPNSDLCKAIVEAADVTVVHEPAEDLPVEKIRYWRMGVPDWTVDPYVFDQSVHYDSWCGPRPILGTIGFPFPWKNYDELAKVTAACGWALLLIAPTCTPAQQIRWHELNPHTRVLPDFQDRRSVLSLLCGCDATAFTYVCHNTGQSGAILQGIAARKPVIALETCRQFRALREDPLGAGTIDWVQDFAGVANRLRHLPIQRVDPGIVALAEQDSWTKVGQKYSSLYRSLVP